MKVTFVYIGAESLAIEYLSSALKQHGHETALAFDPALFDDKQYLDIPFLAKIFDSRGKLVNDIVNSSPNLVAFSVGTDILLWAFEVAKAVKERLDVPIIFGGVHVTAVPERIINMDFVDMVCVGEGDEALVELVDNLDAGKNNHNIQNIWFKRNGDVVKNPARNLIQDLDTLPLPDKDLFEEEIVIRNGKYMLMSSRGCPYKCTYCYNDVLKDFYAGKGKFVRQRSVDNVLDELIRMKEKYNYSSVAFMDDLFLGNRAWFKQFVPKYTKCIDLPYSCMTSTHVVDENIARLLKDSGCTRLQFGIQTMNEATRVSVLKRNFEDTERIKRAIDACDKVGISYSLDHIFGIPGEGEKEFKKTANFFAETKADRFCCYSLFYYPKTEIIQSAKSHGILNEKEIDLIEDGKGTLYVYGSSLKGNNLDLFQHYRKFYSWAPILPRQFRKYLLDTDYFIYLSYIPRIFDLLCESLIAIKTRHPRGRDYIMYYLHHLRKKFFR